MTLRYLRRVPDCLFCRIARKEILSKQVLDDGNVFAFHDLTPQAPVHVLVVPKVHVADVAGLEAHPGLGDELLRAVNAVVRALNLTDGFRVVANNGARAGQSVFHLHFHVLGGRDMKWPPG